MYISHLLT